MSDLLTNIMLKMFDFLILIIGYFPCYLGNEVISILDSSHFTLEEKLMIRELKNKIRNEDDSETRKGLERQLNTIMEKAFIKKQLLRRNEL